MTYQHADSDEAHRIWTKPIPGNILIGEYDDGDYLIYNESRNPWHSLILEPPQMQALLDFSDDVKTPDETLLGEDVQNGKLFVRYQDGAYTFHPEDLDDTPSLSAEQMDALHRLLEKMEMIKQDAEELMKKQEEKLRRSLS